VTGEIVLIAVLVVAGAVYLRGSRHANTHGEGTPGDWAGWAEDDARRLGRRAASAWRAHREDIERQRAGDPYSERQDPR
jgi:hypothetical protein